MSAGGCRPRLSWFAGLQRWSFSTDGAFFLPRLFCVDLTSLVEGFSNDPKNSAPNGGAARMRCIAHFSDL